MNASSDDLSRFARAITHDSEFSPEFSPDNFSPDNFLATLNVGANYSTRIAIDIYRNNYRGNLHDALAGAYPVIEQLVGERFFRLLTRRFIEQQHSKSGNLHRYGAELADFIAGFAPAQGLPYLPDVARLEWACHCAYFAADTPALDINRLAHIAPEHYPDLILTTHAACHLLRSPYPIAAIWHVHQSVVTGQPGATSDFHIDLDSGPCSALVSRVENGVRVNELTEAEAGWLLDIQAGNSLGAATSATLDHYPDFDLRATLLNLVAQGIFTDFTLRTNP